MRSKKVRRKSRRVGIRKQMSGTSDIPRISVFKSNKGVFVQAIDDVNSKTFFGLSSRDIKAEGEKSKWFLVGEKMGEELKKLKIKKAVFDRGGYKYIGRVKDIADGIRSKDINF